MVERKKTLREAEKRRRSTSKDGRPKTGDGETGWSKKPNNLLNSVFRNFHLFFFLYFVCCMYGTVEEGV